MDTHNRLSFLLEQVRNEAATPEEYDELIQLLEQHQDPQLTEQLHAAFSKRPVPSMEADASSAEWRVVLEQAMQVDSMSQAPVVSIRRKQPVARWAGWVAACFLVFAGGWWLLMPGKKGVIPAIPLQAVTDKAPGKNGAVLTLADGREILLDSMGNGTIASEAGTRISIKNYQLVYHSSKNNSGGSFMNTMSTPRGRQYQLQLPDGTMVWLNAATSIKYPVQFAGKERAVELDGEAYFEVKKDAAKPFRVLLKNGAQIDVLGTSFNVNAYSDEAGQKTTLVSGAVKVTKSGRELLLSPGQFALVTAGNMVVNKADTEKVLAWKNGLFDFQDLPLTEVMRQLSRWYDVDVEYENGVPDLELEGRLGRDVSLSKVLAFFNESGISVKLEKNNKLVVSKN